MSKKRRLSDSSGLLNHSEDASSSDKDLIYFQDNIFPELINIYSSVKIDDQKSSNNEIVVRIDLKDCNEAEDFVEEFSAITNTNWIVNWTKSSFQKIVFSKSYVCLHNQRNKSVNSKRNAECPAKLNIVIKRVNRDTMRNDRFLKLTPPLAAVVKISLQHSHNLASTEALGMLRVNQKVKEQYSELFNSGLSVSDAMKFHQNKFLVADDVCGLANASINPLKRQVYYLHTVWRELNLGSFLNPFDKLKEKMELYNSEGAIVKLFQSVDSWAALVVTPIMQRAQSLQSSSEIIFIDSTCSCETTSCTVTVILTASKVGVLPIAVLLQANQTSENYIKAFQLLKENFPQCFGGMSHPNIIMTDDSAAEKKALKSVWPESLQLLCHFHVAQAEWRWLFSNIKNPKEERQRLMKLFQAVMYAKSEEDVNKFYKSIVQEKTTNPSFVNRFLKFFLRKNEWVLFYRLHLITRQHNTNNFSEATIRVLKDEILSRTKAFNVVALIEHIIENWEEYLKTKLLQYAYSRKGEVSLLYKKLGEKIKKYNANDIKELAENTYKIVSASDKNIFYIVDTYVGVCTCAAGISGAFCKHQYLLMKQKKKITFLNAPPLSASEEFFADFKKNCVYQEPYLETSETADIVINLNEKNIFEKEINQVQETNSYDDLATNEEKSLFLDELKRIENFLKGPVSKQAIKRGLIALDKLKSAEDLKNLLSISSINRKKIMVQPTSISRRRPGLVRSGKRVPAGRPPSKIKKCMLKRKRNLGANVSRNELNAKSH